VIANADQQIVERAQRGDEARVDYADEVPAGNSWGGACSRLVQRTGVEGRTCRKRPFIQAYRALPSFRWRTSAVLTWFVRIRDQTRRQRNHISVDDGPACSRRPTSVRNEDAESFEEAEQLVDSCAQRRMGRADRQDRLAAPRQPQRWMSSTRIAARRSSTRERRFEI